MLSIRGHIESTLILFFCSVTLQIWAVFLCVHYCFLFNQVFMQYNTFIFNMTTKEFVAESLVKKACHNSCGMPFGQMRPKY